MTQQAKRSSSSGLFLLALVPVLAASFYAWKVLTAEKKAPLDSSAFDLSEAPEAEPKPARTGYTSKFEQEMTSREVPTGSGLSGFVTEADKMYKPGEAPMSKREREKEFIRKYDKLIEAEQERLAPIGRKYYKKYEIVRQVDAEFGKMPRYMALNAKYAKDRDAHQWARDVIALPEVREALFKHARNPQVWRVAIEMSMEAMKKPPPKKVHDEMLNFFTTDKKMSSWVSTFTKAVIPDMAKMVQQTTPPGTDLSQLSTLGSALTGFKDPLKKKKNKKKKGSKKKKRPSDTAGSKR